MIPRVHLIWVWRHGTWNRTPEGGSSTIWSHQQPHLKSLHSQHFCPKTRFSIYGGFQLHAGLAEDIPVKKHYSSMSQTQKPSSEYSRPASRSDLLKLWLLPSAGEFLAISALGLIQIFGSLFAASKNIVWPRAGKEEAKKYQARMYYFDYHLYIGKEMRAVFNSTFLRRQGSLENPTEKWRLTTRHMQPHITTKIFPL